MRTIRWMYGHMKLDRIMNEVLRNKVGVTSIEDKMKEKRLNWFGQVKMRSVNAPVRRCETINLLNCIRGRGQPRRDGMN